MVWRRAILGVVIAIVSSCSFAQTACSARTPEQALPSGWIVATERSASLSSTSFYRLAQIVVDPELHRRWALIANCTHPERPLQIVALAQGHTIVPTPTTTLNLATVAVSRRAPHSVQTEIMRQQATSSVPAQVAVRVVNPSPPNPSTMTPEIRVGDLVRLWSSDSNVRLEMGVVSLEYGRVGQIIHVRRIGQTALLAGVVVGKDSAELIP